MLTVWVVLVPALLYCAPELLWLQPAESSVTLWLGSHNAEMTNCACFPSGGRYGHGHSYLKRGNGGIFPA